jgi:ribosomal protein S20
MKKLVAAGLAAAGLAGGSVAVAALAPFGTAGAQEGASTTTSPPSSQGAPAPEPPKRAGLLDQTLKSLVDDGTITQAQADAITSRLQDNAQKLREELGPRLGPIGKGLGQSLDKIAQVIGITVDDLEAQLKQGKTLAEIAGDKKQDLITALTDAANARIDKAVADGHLSAEKAATLESQVTERITRLVEQGLPGRHGLRRGPR